MATGTPWGKSQSQKKYAQGIIFYETASHGGFHVAKKLNEKIPDYMRTGGWYEEDIEWAKVAVVFPEFFPWQEVESAEKTLRNWFPNEWEKFYNKKLQPGESLKRDEQLFLEAHKNDFLVLAAWGDWHEKVPEGTVTVLAKRGGRDNLAGEEQWFNLPEEEYTDPFKLVLDPAKHKIVQGLS